MVGETLAIIAVILVLAAMMARSGRIIFSAITLPLISLPVLHLVGTLLKLGAAVIYFDIIGLLFGIILCFVFSKAFRTRGAQIIYLSSCGIFTIALFISYYINLY